MERPPAIDEPTWLTWVALHDATPANRRTTDIPTDNASAIRSINNMVQGALNAQREAGLAAAATGTAAPVTGSDSYKLPFSVKDVPQYTGDYMDYRRKLRDFIYIYQDMPIRQVPSAMFAIKTGLVEKRMSELGSSKDAAEFSAGGRTLIEAWEVWQSWMDGLLISSTQFAQENQTWGIMKTKTKRAQTSQEFYILFEACLFRFREACVRRGATPPTDMEVTRHFIEALPEEILIAARPHATNIETDTYRTHKDLLDALWPAHRKTPQARALPVKRSRDEDSDEEAEAYPLPARKKTSTGLGRCTLRKDLEDTPRVPDTYRGNIGYVRGNSDVENRMAFNRRQKVVEADRCAFGPCRRKRSEHEKGFVTPKEWTGPAFSKAMPATVEEEEDASEERWEDAEE